VTLAIKTCRFARYLIMFLFRQAKRSEKTSTRGWNMCARWGK